MGNVRFQETSQEGDYAPDQDLSDLMEMKKYLASQESANVPPVDTQAETNGPAVDSAPEPKAAQAATPFSSVADSALAKHAKPSRKDELQGLMSQYESAMAESNKRKSLTGAATAQMALTAPNAADAYGKSFEAFNSAPTRKFTEPMAVAKQSNDLEAQTSKIDYSREYGDPNSDVSSAAREIAKKQLNMPEIPDTMSAEDIEKVLPGIKLLVTQSGMNLRSAETNDTQRMGIKSKEEQARAERERKASEFATTWDNKFKQQAISDYQKFKRVQEMNKGGMNKAIVISGLGQRDASGGAGAGTGSGSTLTNVLGDEGTRYLTVKPGLTPSKQATQEVEKFNGAMSGAYDAMLQIQNIMNGSFPFPGEAAWRDLQANAYSAAQAQNQIDKNGVMNFGDFYNVMQELGKPGSYEQMAMSGVAPAVARQVVQDTLNRMKRRYEKYVDSQGFMPSQTPGVGATAGGGGRGGGNINPASPDAIDTAARSTNPELPPVVAPRGGKTTVQSPQSTTSARPPGVPPSARPTKAPDGEKIINGKKYVIRGGWAWEA